ncbi:MAG: dephospho-CoA kinase [Candidatus Eisenbacteria bacterium]|nr:dephospho-CoA kinase [Candidatus Eisenbacteria bacterium]
MFTDRARRAGARDRLFIVGLVGRAGSGKSTVARALAAAGATVLDGDRIGHSVTDTDPDVRAALQREYGAGVYRADGALDRARVGARVFADPDALERLNRLVHPRILERIRARLAELRGSHASRGSPASLTVVVDAALMLDWGFERECDAVIAVISPEREQISRLMRARSWNETQARSRLGAQRTNEAFAEAADAVIDNRGAEESLAATARATLEGLRARAGLER